MIRDIYTEKRGGTFSTSKLWRQVACLVATYIAVVNAAAIDPWLLMVYLGTVGGFEVVHRWMERKAQ